MENFARLETGPFGQILATISSEGDGVELTFRISDVRGIEVRVILDFTNDKDGWKEAEKNLAEADLQDIGCKLQAGSNAILEKYEPPAPSEEA